MIISLLTFVQTQKSLGEIGLSPLAHLEKSKRKVIEIITYIGSLLIIPIIMIMVSNTTYTDYFMYLIGPASLLYLIYEMRSFTLSENRNWIFYYTKFFAGADGRTSLGLFTFGWFVITFGELCLSPIGMSAMTKLSPQKTQAVIMGMWFLASAYGQYFAGLLGANIAGASENASNAEKLIVYADGYKQLAIYALIAGVVLILISPLVKKLMQEVR
jgi:dipeptide/tripeptide permease